MDDRRARAYQIAKWRMAAEVARENLVASEGRWDKTHSQRKLDQAEENVYLLLAEQREHYPEHGELARAVEGCAKPSSG